MMAWTPQLPSTTCVTPKSTATDISEIASSSLREIVGIAEPVQDPLVLGLEQWVGEPRQCGTRQAGALVHDELEGAGERALDGRAAELGVALRGVGVSRGE